MLMQHHARNRRSRHGLFGVRVSLVVMLLGSPAWLAFGSTKPAKPAAPAVTAPKDPAVCAPPTEARSKDLPPSSTAPSQANTQSTTESPAQDASRSDTLKLLKLESVQKDGVEMSEPECIPGQNPDDPQCQASKTAKDSALQCVRDTAQKPDLAIEPEPAK